MQEREPLYHLIAASVEALQDCERRGWTDGAAHYAEELAELAKHLPASSGLERGTELCLDECTPERLVFATAFHHLDSLCHYAGWTKHKIIVTPTFTSITVQVTGPDRDNVKRYLRNAFYDTLTASVPRPALR